MEQTIILGARAARHALSTRYGSDEAVVKAVMTLGLKLREIVNGQPSDLVMYTLFIMAHAVAVEGLEVEVQSKNERVN